MINRKLRLLGLTREIANVPVACLVVGLLCDGRRTWDRSQFTS